MELLLPRDVGRPALLRGKHARPLDRFITERVAPELGHLGFVRSRRSFFLVGSSDDVAEVAFRSVDLGLGDLGLAVTTSLYLREFNEDRGWGWPEKFYGSLPGVPLWTRNLEVPQPGPGLTGSVNWHLDLDDVGRIELLLDAVRSAADEVRGLADRATFVAWLQSLDPDGTSPHVWTAPISRALSIINAD